MNGWTDGLLAAKLEPVRPSVRPFLESPVAAVERGVHAALGVLDQVVGPRQPARQTEVVGFGGHLGGDVGGDLADVGEGREDEPLVEVLLAHLLRQRLRCTSNRLYHCQNSKPRAIVSLTAKKSGANRVGTLTGGEEHVVVDADGAGDDDAEAESREHVGVVGLPGHVRLPLVLHGVERAAASEHRGTLHESNKHTHQNLKFVWSEQNFSSVFLGPIIET